jgi:hypothetical protein
MSHTSDRDRLSTSDAVLLASSSPHQIACDIDTAVRGDSERIELGTLSQPDAGKEKAYSCFSRREKWGIISLISLASIFSLVAFLDPAIIFAELTDRYLPIFIPQLYRPWLTLSMYLSRRSI